MRTVSDTKITPENMVELQVSNCISKVSKFSKTVFALTGYVRNTVLDTNFQNFAKNGNFSVYF